MDSEQKTNSCFSEALFPKADVIYKVIHTKLFTKLIPILPP